MAGKPSAPDRGRKTTDIGKGATIGKGPNPSRQTTSLGPNATIGKTDATRIQVDHKTLADAGGQMTSAANTTREAVSRVVQYSKPVTGPGTLDAVTTGSMVATDALYGFWYCFQEQLTLSSEVYDQLSGGLKSAAALYQTSDQQSATAVNNAVSPTASGGAGMATPDNQAAALLRESP